MNYQKKFPDFSFENKFWKEGKLVIGIDEVGRGALSGPVYVAAVCFQPQLSSKELRLYEALGINDSKKLTKKQREKLAKIIKENALTYSICFNPVEIINSKGIVLAVERAMISAVIKVTQALSAQNFQLLIDGFPLKNLSGLEGVNQQAIVKGDQLSISIAAASIIAKVARDNHMKMLSKKYLEYKWDRNKGYGTKAHIAAIKAHGLTPEHRELFVRKIAKTKVISKERK